MAARVRACSNCGFVCLQVKGRNPLLLSYLAQGAVLEELASYLFGGADGFDARTPATTTADKLANLAGTRRTLSLLPTSSRCAVGASPAHVFMSDAPLLLDAFFSANFTLLATLFSELQAVRCAPLCGAHLLA